MSVDGCGDDERALTRKVDGGGHLLPTTRARMQQATIVAMISVSLRFFFWFGGSCEPRSGVLNSFVHCFQTSDLNKE